MKKKNILITGANGFVGSHFLDFLIKKNPNNNIWLSKRWHLSNLKNIETHLKKVHLIDCDITDPISTRQMITKQKMGQFILTLSKAISGLRQSQNIKILISYNWQVIGIKN